ncbi:MAG: DUF89 domain-containing protein [Candidatus Hydrothermarchaeales archaeon]
MKINPECIPCLFERAKFECDLAFNDEEEKIDALSEIAQYIGANLSSNVVPAALGTERERIIKRRSGKDDPYAELKRASNKVAAELLPIAQEFYKNCEDEIMALIKIAAVANSMEYGVKGHDFDAEDFRGEFEEVLNEGLIGDMTQIKNALDKYTKILYLTDNAGEVVFDKFIAKKLADMGKDVVISPKSEPIINDVTTQDIKGLNFGEFKIISSGSFVGLSLEEAPADFLELFWDEDYLVFAKGMGYYETISEFEGKLKGRLIYVLRAKCISVAESLGVNRGELVAKIV